MLESPKVLSKLVLLLGTGQSAGNQEILLNINGILRDYTRYILIGWRYSPGILEIGYYLLINNMLLAIKFKQSLQLEVSSNAWVSSTISSEGDPGEESEEPGDPEEKKEDREK